VSHDVRSCKWFQLEAKCRPYEQKQNTTRCQDVRLAASKNVGLVCLEFATRTDTKFIGSRARLKYTTNNVNRLIS